MTIDQEVFVEKGTFQTRLAQLEFLEKSRESDFSQERITPLKSSEKLTSSTALLRQNEDLSARLKVTMEKLIQYEEQIDQYEGSNKMLQKSNEALQDQMLIWKEKERLWIEKVEKAELKFQELETQFPAYQIMKNDLNRYKKYHEKIKLQIKPYIQQLKDYSAGLIEQIRELNRENMNQKYEIKNLHTELQDMKSELSTRVTAHTLSLQEIENLHEKEIESLKAEINSLRESNIVLSSKAERLDQALARQDELENATIALKRNLDASESRVASETEGLRTSLQISRNDITKKNLQIETLENQNQSLQNTVNKLDLETLQLSEQLVSLRYIWEEKSAQIDQMKAMIQSLEKINLELSQKLNSNTKKNLDRSAGNQLSY